MSYNLTPDLRADCLIEALPFIQRFRGQTFVIKCGGSAMEDEQNVERFLRDIVFLEAVGINPVVVHGGGKSITAKMQTAGLQAKFVNGLRVTDASAIQIVEEALDCEINPRIVQTIQRFGGSAEGISGKAVFIAKRVTPQVAEDGSEVDIGFVGEVVEVKTDKLSGLIDQEIVPVISPIGATESGQVLNINADIAAAALAAQLKAAKLIFVSDVLGIMRDRSDVNSLIPSVSSDDIAKLTKQKVIEGGMIPKVQSALSALQNGVSKVHLICGGIPHCLLLEIFSMAGIGTEILTARV